MIKNPIKARFIFGLFVSFSQVVQADTLLEAVPSTWRIADYTNGEIVTFFTGTSCGGSLSELTLSPSVSNDERNRYWSMILTAKAANRSVGVWYETTSGNCNISSFYIN